MTATQEHPARLLISSSRKPISYLPAAKRLLQEHGEVQLSALGIACSSMVTVAEILKSRNLGKEKHVCTMLERLDDEAQPRQKPKMEVLLVKTAEFDTIIAAEKDTAATEAADRAAAGAKAEVVKADKAAAPQEEDEVPTTAAAEAVDALTDEVVQQAAEEAAAA